MDLTLQLPAFLHGTAPTPSVVCSVDGDAVPDGGAPQAAPVMPPAPQGAPTITPEIQALIDAARADERTKTKDSVWRQAREKYEKGQPSPAKQPDSPPSASAPDDTRHLLQLRDDFDDAIAEHQGLDLGQRKFLRSMVLDKRPPDVAAFVRETVTQLGIGRTAPPNPAAGSTTAPTGSPPPPPQASPAASPPSRVSPADQRIVDMSPADRNALVARIGNKAFADRLRAENRSDERRVSVRR